MKMISGAVVVAAMFLGGAAQAASLDFVAEAAGAERGIVSGSSLVFDGLSVQFDSNFAPYFDDLSGGPAGLGVCKLLTVLDPVDQCNPSNDDNLTAGEWVTLTFARAVKLSGFSFTDANHNDLNGSSKNLMVGLNGAVATETTFAAMVAGVFSGLTSITFAHGSMDPSDYYINGVTATPVPLPAAASLLAAGLGALSIVRRRHNAV